MVKIQNQSGTGGIQVGGNYVRAERDINIAGRSAASSSGTDPVEAEASQRSSARLAGSRSFISVSTQEAQVAVVLQSWIDELFPDLSPCFVAVKELRLGDRWLEEVEGALESIRLFFIVFSGASFKKHWLHFEAGTAWIRKRPIIVLTHSDLIPSQLPSPYSSFQGCKLDKPGETRRLLGDIARHLDRDAPQRLDFASMDAEMTAAIAKCGPAP